MSITSVNTADLASYLETASTARDHVVVAFNDLVPLAQSVSAACQYRQPSMPGFNGMSVLIDQYARTEGFELASDNLARFHAAGGRVLYGTDLGNGPLPVGLNRREIEALLDAGLSPDAVITALTSTAGLDWAADRVTVMSGDRPTDPAGFVDWICTARAVSSGAQTKEDA